MQLGDHGGTSLTENILIEEMRARFLGDDIVETWVKPFNEAAAVLRQAHGQLGDIDLDDTASVVAQGGDAADVWSKAQTAVGTLTTITNAWTALIEFTRSANIDPRYPALRIADVDAATWRDFKLDHKRIGTWDATLAGLRLALPTGAEYRQRITDLQREQAEAAMAAAPVDRSRQGVRDWANKINAAQTNRAAATL